GTTDSGNFPVTPGVIQPTIGGQADVFISKLTAAGTGLAYSTFLGGLGNDTGNAIAVDTFGNAYFTGQTNSTNFPVTQSPDPAPIQATFAGQRDAYLAEINSIGTKRLYATYLGGALDDNAAGIATDSSGNV